MADRWGVIRSWLVNAAVVAALAILSVAIPVLVAFALTLIPAAWLDWPWTPTRWFP